MKKVCERILKLIREKGLSLRTVSDAVGMSPTGLNRTLKDGSLRVSVLIRLAEYFEVPMNYFFLDIELDPETLKAKRSVVIQALENGTICISIEPMLRDMIKNDFTPDVVQQVFNQSQPISFNGLINNHLLENSEDSDRFFNMIEFALYDALLKKDIIMELNKLKYINLMQVVSEIKEFVLEIRIESDDEHRKSLYNDHNMTSD